MDQYKQLYIYPANCFTVQQDVLFFKVILIKYNTCITNKIIYNPFLCG